MTTKAPAVRTRPPVSTNPPITVRLVGRSGLEQRRVGRVQVSKGGRYWYSICGKTRSTARRRGFGLNNAAQVVCRQLGFKGGKAFAYARYGPMRVRGLYASICLYVYVYVPLSVYMYMSLCTEECCVHAPLNVVCMHY